MLLYRVSCKWNKKYTCIHVFLTFMNVVQHSTSMTSVRVIAVSELYSMIERPCRTQLPAKPNSKLWFRGVLLLCYCQTWFKNIKVWYVWSTAYELSLISYKLHEWQKATYLDEVLEHVVPYDHPSACEVKLFCQHCLILKILVFHSFSLNL